MNIQKTVRYLIILLGVPAIVSAGVLLWRGRQYNLVSLGVAVGSCVPFFMTYERGQANTRKLVLIAVMTAISVAGRFIFAPIPFFKPVTAVTVLTALSFGPEAGFLTGAFSALISDMFFGQGPWTPFQMMAWGMTGFLAGVLSNQGLLKKPVPLAFYGVFAGMLFSFIMDIWTVLSYRESFEIARYGAALLAAAPVTLVYCVSNVIFLLVMRKPVGDRLVRIKQKYGI